MDKENKRVKVKSKIPLPVEPLPPIPQILMKRQQEVENERHPLQPINWPTVHPNTNAAVLKNEKVHPKPKCHIKLDTRHVTHRRHRYSSEDLDWNYHVFRDSTVEDSSILIIGEDEDEKKKDNPAGNYFANNNGKNCLEEAKKAITPALKTASLEPNRIKNIKRSLKRPHSRELQGISPKVKQDRGDERHKRRLEFSKVSEHRLQSSGLWEKAYMNDLNRDYTEDMFTYLLSREVKTNMSRTIESNTRACVINWLMKINGAHGNPAVVQSAQWYFDAVLKASKVQYESLQLVAAACYWIAQKTHGSAYSARRLVRSAGEAFNCSRLIAAEKAILIKLKFPSQPIIPQEFITYLSWWCEDKHRGEIELAATFLCMTGMMMDKALCHEYPSVIAAAAVRNAILLLGKKEAIVKLHMNSVYRAADSKTKSISIICLCQRNAILCMSSPYCKNTAPLEFYGVEPHYIAQKIIQSAKSYLSSVKM